MHADTAPSPALARPTSPTDLFFAFTGLALQGFGGVIAVAQRVLCEDKRWLTKEEFLEVLAVGQVLPGPNVCNVALMVGDRFFGWRGAFAALAGLMVAPLAIVLALTAVYAHYAQNPAVAGALRGMAAVSAGLIIGTALKLAASLRKSALGVPACVAVGGATFVAIAWMRWPLVWVLLGVGSLSMTVAWLRLRAAAVAASDGTRRSSARDE
jgi:chromate transporter